MRAALAAIVGIIAFMSCSAALAQSDGAAITGYCTNSGAFDQHFGELRDGGRRRGLFSFNGETIALTDFVPFTEAEVVATDDTRRTHLISGIANFKTEAEAQAAYESAANSFNQDQRFISQPTSDAASIAYYVDGPNGADGFKVELTQIGQTLTLACSDTALSRTAGAEWRENFGLGAMPPPASALTQGWDANAIAQQHCTPNGAFGQRFGQRARGRSRQGLTEFNLILTSPTETFPPFQHFEVTVTPRTRMVQSITAAATFANARTAADAQAALVTAYEANGRLPERSEDHLMTGPAGTVFSSEEYSDIDYYVMIARDGREVRLVCANNTLLRQAFDEAFGRLN